MCTYEKQGGSKTPKQIDCKKESCPASAMVSVRIALSMVTVIKLKRLQYVPSAPKKPKPSQT